MIQNYVIKTKFGFIEYASIFQVEGVVSINKTSYTDDLQRAKVFTEEDYKDDIKAWENYYEIKEGQYFKFLPIKFSLINE